MTAPSYRWVCHKCGQSNEPGIAVCSVCECPAVVSGLALESPLPEAEARRIREARAERSEAVMLFFPEGLVAAAVAITAPAWAISLALHGHVVAGLSLIAGVGVGAYGFVVSMKRREKWLAYASVLSILFVAYLVYSASTSGGLCK